MNGKMMEHFILIGENLQRGFVGYQLLLIILINLAFFARTIRYGMVIDDTCRKFHVKDLPKSKIKRIYRLTKYSGYGGIPVWADHVLTILLHTLACVLIYICLGPNDLSFITALLFSVLPVNNQVSIWLNGKRFAIITILVLLMYWIPPYGLVFYLIAPLWHYGALPAILLYTDYPWAFGLLFMLVLMFHRRIINKIGTRWQTIPPGEIKIIRPGKVVILIKMIGYIFWHTVFPRRMSFWHMFMERIGFSDEDNKRCYSFNSEFWVGLSTTVTLLVLMYLNWSNPIGYGIAWWFLFIFMWCQFPIGLTQALSERVYYLPAVGLMYALSSALLKIPYYNYHIILMVLTYYATKLWFYMPAYRNIEEFYRYALHEFPDHFRARAHVIQRNLHENKIFFCLRDCGQGLRHNKKDCTLNLLMCQSLMAIGQWKVAQEYLDKAKKLLIPGQEARLNKIINNFENIMKDIQEKGVVPKRIQPGETVEIKPSQIAK